MADTSVRCPYCHSDVQAPLDEHLLYCDARDQYADPTPLPRGNTNLLEKARAEAKRREELAAEWHPIDARLVIERFGNAVRKHIEELGGAPYYHVRTSELVDIYRFVGQGCFEIRTTRNPSSASLAALQLRAQPHTARYERACAHCGTYFTSTRKDQVFCQPRCRVFAHRLNRRRPERLTLAQWGKRAEQALAEVEGLLRTISEDVKLVPTDVPGPGMMVNYHTVRAIDEVLYAIEQARAVQAS
jgi:hypothetical protein